MAKKEFQGRIVNKHDLEVNWNLATNFIPLDGEIIIYDADINYDYPRIKIGNGIDKVGDLSFLPHWDAIDLESIDNINTSIGALDKSDTAVSGQYVSAVSETDGIINVSRANLPITSLTLNGSSNTTPNFYAPTTAGTSGYVLKSNGSGAPTWTSATLTDTQVTTAADTSSTKSYVTTCTGATTGTLTYHTSVYVNHSTGVLMGAAWNDYAEYREQVEEIKPGYCVVSSDNGKVSLTTEKFQACDGIVSDTFGFAIGETDECKTPLAVAGRVLAYAENPEELHSGDTVCAGPNGKVIKMTREEIREWPDRIVGVVSEIPTYETWGTGNVKVNGRIWIKIR